MDTHVFIIRNVIMKGEKLPKMKEKKRERKKRIVSDTAIEMTKEEVSARTRNERRRKAKTNYSSFMNS